MQRLLRAVVSLIFLPVAITTIQPVMAQGDPIAEGFAGAELYAQLDAEGNGSIHLNRIQTCSTPSDKKESVSLFEKGLNRLVGIYELKLDSTKTLNGAPLGCATNIKGCFTINYYSAALKLGNARSIYEATWGFCCLTNGYVNLKANLRQGVSLSAEFTHSESGAGNHIPVLSSLDHIYTCSNAKSGIRLEISDKDTSDKHELTFVPVLSAEPAEGNLFEYPANTPNTYKERKTSFGYTGSVLTGRPPFAQIAYKDGFSGVQPGSRYVKLNQNAGSIEFDNPAKGSYLLGISISDKRGNTILSQHSLVLSIRSY